MKSPGRPRKNPRMMEFLRPLRTSADRACAYCGYDFKPKTARRRFCSDTCERHAKSNARKYGGAGVAA